MGSVPFRGITADKADKEARAMTPRDSTPEERSDLLGGPDPQQHEDEFESAHEQVSDELGGPDTGNEDELGGPSRDDGGILGGHDRPGKEDELEGPGGD
jgi:hypothetical protein